MGGWDDGKGGWDDGKGGYGGDPYAEQWPQEEEEYFTKTQANIDKVIIILSLALAGGLLGPLLAPIGWNEKSTHIWTLYFGLSCIETRLDTIAGAAMQAVGQMHDAMAKSSVDSGNWPSLAKLMSPSEPHSVQFLRDQFCNLQLWTFGLLGNMCEIFSYLLYASWACQLGHVICITLLLFGAMLMCMKPKKCARWSCLIIYTAGFIAHSGTLVLYFGVSFLLKDLFVPEFLSNPEFTISIMFIASAGLNLLVVSCPLLLFFCGRLPKWKNEEDLPPQDDFMFMDDPFKGGKGFDDGKGFDGGKGFDDGKGWDDGKGKW